ncbi:MAG: serine/threonine-protein kinase [Actinomycetota bacterium]
MSRDKSSWGFRQGDEIALGRYALQLLGDGATSEVYLAWDDRLFCLVVAKVVRPDLVGTSRGVRRLAREAEALSRLSHPLILRCFEAVLDGDRPHLVEEFVEGMPLWARVRRAGLELEQLLPLFLRLCSALHYLEGERMVHLDVKPGNIILGAQPRLIDFSLARTVTEAGTISRRVGTDAYMAPETCDPPALGPIGTPADVWGLGATMYHAVAGRVPFPRIKGFDEHDLPARFPQLDRGPEPLPEGLPDPLAPLIMRCLSKEPSDRPSASEVGLALERSVAG